MFLNMAKDKTITYFLFVKSVCLFFSPDTYKRSQNEWILDPGLSKVGLRCVFDGVHRATAVSENELTHSMLFGKGRNGNS